MAEMTILVCDVCGEPASETVSLKVGGRSLVKDLCESHFGDLTNGARPAKRGRPKGSRSRPAGEEPRKSTGGGGRRRTRARKEEAAA